MPAAAGIEGGVPWAPGLKEKIFQLAAGEELPPGHIAMNLYAPTCEPIAILSDIYAAMRTAKEFGFVIAQIYGLGQGMFDIGMTPGGAVDARDF